MCHASVTALLTRAVFLDSFALAPALLPLHGSWNLGNQLMHLRYIHEDELLELTSAFPPFSSFVCLARVRLPLSVAYGAAEPPCASPSRRTLLYILLRLISVYPDSLARSSRAAPMAFHSCRCWRDS